MTRVFCLLLIFLPLTVCGQKAFKPIRTALKAKNYKEVINQVNKLREDSTYRHSADLCLYMIEGQKGLNDAENTKLYLKKNYDTVSFFSTTRQIVEEAVKVDSIQRAELGDKDAEKSKEWRTAMEHVKRYFPNIHPAARFFFRKGNYAEAMDYLRLSVDLPATPLGKHLALSGQNRIPHTALYLLAAFNEKNYPEVHRYETDALADTTSRPLIVESLVYTAEAEGDTARYHHWLREGFNAYPEQTVFFTRLADLYAQHHDFQGVMQIADELLQKDSASVSARLAQCMALLNMAQLDACIQAGRDLLAVDTANVEAHYYIGASFVGKATQVQLPANALSKAYTQALKQQQAYYREAETSLETYRTLAPNLQKRWAPLLYKVYLALNEGKKFAEIEKILQWLKM